ncbi:hypothetical protein [Cerasicoccus frondis]|uniref:hypothetical protein n=1 Tax=Cerasicoccus frondis TaxID=490090 RepID=UPI00285265A1|nr:hypothetical protein [Cerasicoccus frondis]
MKIIYEMTTIDQANDEAINKVRRGVDGVLKMLSRKCKHGDEDVRRAAESAKSHFDKWNPSQGNSANEPA